MENQDSKEVIETGENTLTPTGVKPDSSEVANVNNETFDIFLDAMERRSTLYAVYDPNLSEDVIRIAVSPKKSIFKPI